MTHIAIYARVSSKAQDTKSQRPDLERWIAAQDQPVKWYHDKFSGKSMDRPGWLKLEADMRAGLISGCQSRPGRGPVSRRTGARSAVARWGAK